VSGIIGFFVAIRVFNIKPSLPSFKNIAHQFREGWHIFISTIAISVYTTSNTFILGLFTNNTIVGYYSGAEKIIRAVQGLMSPVSQSLYPHISNLASKSREAAIAFLRKVTKYVAIATFLLSLALFIFADKIVLILLGSGFEQSTIILRILAFLPFIIGLSNVFAVLGLMNFGEQKKISKVVIAGGILSILLTMVLVPLYAGLGSAISWLITEIFITSAFSYYFYKLLRLKNDKENIL
jgi:PST family polysaccharide transporter